MNDCVKGCYSGYSSIFLNVFCCPLLAQCQGSPQIIDFILGGLDFILLQTINFFF